MGLVLIIAGGLLLLGYVAGIPRPVTYAVVGVLFGAVLIIQLMLPDANALRQATGGSAQSWIIFAGVVALILGYSAMIRNLKKRAPMTKKLVEEGPFTSGELERYARHIVLREIGGLGQQRLKSAKVLVVGAGGLGSPALLYLAAAGVGIIGVVDDDEVSLSNLQRQVLHSEDRIGMPKVFSAEKGLNAINPHVSVQPYNRRLTKDNAQELMQEFDLVLDGSDNFATRHMVNETCVDLGKPLISAAISQWEGQISLYHPAYGAPCYACVFPEVPAEGLAPSCAEAGVMGALPGVIGSMIAVEAIKFITGAGEVLKGEMLIYDALYGESRKLKVKRRGDCKVCGGD